MAKELTAEYGLRSEQGKRLEATHLDALHEPDAKRYRIYTAIRQVLPECRDLGELETRLQERGVAGKVVDWMEKVTDEQYKK